MKEITYQDWVQNHTPRMMLVWNDNPSVAVERKVVYFSKADVVYPVIALTPDDVEFDSFKHCAELEPKRLMTHKELNCWLREKPTRELICTDSPTSTVFCFHTYCRNVENLSVDESYLIRDGDEPWRPPYVEVESNK